MSAPLPVPAVALAATARGVAAAPDRRLREYWLLVSDARFALAQGRPNAACRDLAFLRARYMQAIADDESAWAERYRAALADIGARISGAAEAAL